MKETGYLTNFSVEMCPLETLFNFIKQGLIATRLSVLEALVIKVNENTHPWYYVDENIHPWLHQHMCTVDSVQCSVALLQEPVRPEQIL